MRVAKRTDDRVSVMNELIQGYVMETSLSGKVQTHHICFVKEFRLLKCTHGRRHFERS